MPSTRRPSVAGAAVLVLLAGVAVRAGAQSTPTEAPAAAARVTARSPGLRAALGRQGFVSSWLVLGPFPYSTPRGNDPWGIDIDFLADAGGETRAQPVHNAEVRLKQPTSPGLDRVRWTAVQSDRGYVDLNGRMKPNDYVVGYAAVYLISPRAQELFLKIGSDDGARAWLNGQMVYDHPRPRDAIVDDDVVRVKLRGGANLLLLKVEERRGQWGFYVRLLDDLRRPPPGVSLLLPGSGFEALKLLGQALTTRIPREIQPDGAILKPEVRADAGYPLVGQNLQARAQVRAVGARTPLAQSGWQASSYSTLGRSRTSFSLPLRNVPDGDYMVRIEVGLKGGAPFYIDDTRVVMRQAAYREITRARATFARVPAPDPSRARMRAAHESVAYTIESLEALIADGDKDGDYLEREARRAARLAEALLAGQDPYQGERGAFLRAYRSPFDGRLQKYAVYVPRGYDPRKKYPLLVALHGLGGEVMMAIRVALGIDQRPDEPYLRALRHLPPLPEVDYLIVAPYGYGDIAYRGIGTDDVLRVIAEMKRSYSVDDDRVTLAGWSMGGIGVFEVGMRHADQFAALVALCGYADVGLYGSAYTRRRPYERDLFEGERSVNYAENGRNVPLFIIHGTNDAPHNSLVFADRYTSLGYKLSVELPEAGHNVWGYAFEGGWLLKKLAPLRRVRSPAHVRLRAFGYRHRRLYWVAIEEIADLGRFARVEARVEKGNLVEVKTENTRRLVLAPGPSLVDPTRPLRLRIDGKTVTAPSAGPVLLARAGSGWTAEPFRGGPPLRPGDPFPPLVAPSYGLPRPVLPAATPSPNQPPPPKQPGASGPILDTIYERTLVVYGTQPTDATERDTLLRVARELARYRRGARVELPVKADSAVTAEEIARHHLVLVGTPQQNLVVSRIADRLPLRIGRRDITVGSRTYKGRDLGMAVVYPNPLAPGRTVTVWAATSGPALFDGLHLPRLKPDYVVWDRRLSKDSGGFFLGKEREVLEAGYFDRRWQLPERPYRGPLR